LVLILSPLLETDDGENIGIRSESGESEMVGAVGNGKEFMGGPGSFRCWACS
jgi:hypothetical protein